MTASDRTFNSNAAFLERVFLEYGPPLQQFLRRRLASDEEASDAAQEVFLRLARPGAREAAEGRERAYLFLTARNLLIDRHRRWEVHRSDAPLPLDEAEALPASDDTEQLAMLNETVEVLRQGIASLNRRNREVFVLHRFAGRGYRQIAMHLGISERTVERRMSRALSHIRRTFERSTNKGRRLPEDG